MKNHIIRSGSWHNAMRNVRSAYKGYDEPELRHHYFGLRLGLDPRQPLRAIRGGSWIDNKSLARSAFRSYNRQGNRGNRISLRLGMSVEL